MCSATIDRIVLEMTNIQQDLKCLRYLPENEFDFTIDILGDLIDWIEKIRNEEPALTNFIPWVGGEQPLPDLSHVQVKFRNSDHDTNDNYYAQELDWVHGEDETDNEFDIVAYRASDVQPVFQYWYGGVNPAGEQMVEYAFRADPTVILTTFGGFLDWSHDPEDSDADIVLYRIIH